MKFTIRALVLFIGFNFAISFYFQGILNSKLQKVKYRELKFEMISPQLSDSDKIIENKYSSQAPSSITFESEQDDLALPEAIQQFNRFTVSIVKDFIILYYGKRYFARFYALETIARVPYFSYVSVLHLFETLGWFRKQEYIKLHFAESWNELHHLLIMEELGGNAIFLDRFVAQHVAFVYYWIVVFLYMTAPAVAYDLNKNVEKHAYATYHEYLTTHEAELRSQPAPAIAKEYYETGDLSLFDAFQNSEDRDSIVTEAVAAIHSEDTSSVNTNPLTPGQHLRRRRPSINNLYDVFINIRDDEAEHVYSMLALQREACRRAMSSSN